MHFDALVLFDSDASLVEEHSPAQAFQFAYRFTLALIWLTLRYRRTCRGLTHALCALMLHSSDMTLPAGVTPLV